VVQNPPGVDDVELPERCEIIAIQNVALLNHPTRGVEMVPPAQFETTGDRPRIIIE